MPGSVCLWQHRRTGYLRGRLRRPGPALLRADEHLQCRQHLRRPGHGSSHHLSTLRRRHSALLPDGFVYGAQQVHQLRSADAQPMWRLRRSGPGVLCGSLAVRPGSALREPGNGHAGLLSSLRWRQSHMLCRRRVRHRARMRQPDGPGTGHVQEHVWFGRGRLLCRQQLPTHPSLSGWSGRRRRGWHDLSGVRSDRSAVLQCRPGLPRRHRLRWRRDDWHLPGVRGQRPGLLRRRSLQRGLRLPGSDGNHVATTV